MKFFWDTNLFIYLWEESPLRLEAEEFADTLKAGGHSLATSALTVGELLVQPMRRGRSDLAQSFLAAFTNLEVVPFQIETAECFARLRSVHATLRPPDAIQLACAAAVGADFFVTNDERLSQLTVPGIGRICTFTLWRSCFE